MNDPLHGAPGYWRHEESGVLAPVVERYLLGKRPLAPAEIDILRRYLVQWIGAPVWEANPHLDSEGARELARLRALAAAIRTTKDVDQWVEAAVLQGMDPL